MSNAARQTALAQPVRFADLLAPPSVNQAIDSNVAGTESARGASGRLADTEPSTEGSGSEGLDTPMGMSPPRPAAQSVSKRVPTGGDTESPGTDEEDNMSISTEEPPAEVDDVPVEGDMGARDALPAQVTPSIHSSSTVHARVPADVLGHAQYVQEEEEPLDAIAVAGSSAGPNDTSRGAPAKVSTIGPFAPLQTQLPEPGQLETLAPTTPSDVTPSFTPVEMPRPDSDANEQVGAAAGKDDTNFSLDGPPVADDSTQQQQLLPVKRQTARVATSGFAQAPPPQEPDDKRALPVLTYAPFGLQGLQKTFPMRGPDNNKTAQLLSEKQAVSQLQTLGLPPKDARPGTHLLHDGGAIVVHQERAYRVNHLDPTCVDALRTAPETLLTNFMHAAESIQKSQEIARLTSVSKSAAAVANSAVVACPGAEVLRDRLGFLKRNCDDWASARNKVAKLMHQRKARADQIESLKKQLSTMTDVLAKDTEAVATAAKEERRVAAAKQKIVLALSAEMSNEVAGLARLRKSVVKNS